MIQLETELHRYILGRIPGERLPKALRYDVLVQYLRRRVRNGYCPFCGRGFRTSRGLVNHLTHGHHQCKQNLDEFIRLTLDRYMIIRSERLRDYIMPEVITDA